MRLSLVVLDEAKEIVVRQPVAARADGSFSTAIAAGALGPGRYRFGVLTGAQPSRAVAGGSFTVAGGSASVEPVTAEPVQPVISRPVRPADTRRTKGFSGFLDRLNSNLENQQGRSSTDRHAADPEQNQPSPAARSAEGAYSVFFRTLGLAIPGVAYTTDNYATNTRTVTVASGAVTKSSVRISPDGTYMWNSAWDGRIIKGRWKPAGSGIILVNAQSGRDWRVERMAQPSGAAEVTVWDQNSIWYNGTPIGK